MNGAHSSGRNRRPKQMKLGRARKPPGKSHARRWREKREREIRLNTYRPLSRAEIEAMLFRLRSVTRKRTLTYALEMLLAAIPREKLPKREANRRARRLEEFFWDERRRLGYILAAVGIHDIIVGVGNGPALVEPRAAAAPSLKITTEIPVRATSAGRISQGLLDNLVGEALDEGTSEERRREILTILTSYIMASQPGSQGKQRRLLSYFWQAVQAHYDSVDAADRIDEIIYGSRR